jgi:hypothetical protein
MHLYSRRCQKESDDYGVHLELSQAGPQLVSSDFEWALDLIQSSQADAIGAPKARFF